MQSRRAALGHKHPKGLLIAKLRKKVGDASKATAVKLAQKDTSKDVQSEQASFEANLTAEVKDGASRNAKRIASTVVAKPLSSKAGLAVAVAELARQISEKERHRSRPTGEQEGRGG